MKKEAGWLCLSLVVAVIVGLAGCARKPAYSEMDANRTSRNQNQSAEGQTAASTPSATEPSAAEAAQPAPAPPLAAIKSPTFLDQAKGGIKDLPSYPNAYRVSTQLGPIQGLNTMSLGFTSADPMDKIAAFYDKVIKENKWTVVDKIIDPEFSEWTLKKGEDHNAKVQVKKDQQTGAFGIVMVRGEKLEAPGK